MRRLIICTVFLLSYYHISAQNPGDISANPLLWLKADAGITTSSGLVTDWQDQSGNGHHATQVTSSDRPRYITNTSGRPGLEFKRNDFLRINGGILGSQQVSDLQILIVAKTYGHHYNYILYEPCSPQQLKLSLPYSVGWAYAQSIYFDAGRSSGDERHYSQWGGTWWQNHLWNIESSQSNSTQEIQRDFLHLSSDNTAGLITGTNSTMIIGGDGSSSRNFNGEIMELIVFDQTLSSDDQDAVQRYLYEKYKMGTPWLNDIYAYESSYKKDITGIGRKSAYDFEKDSATSHLLTISNPSDQDDDEYLTFGHDGQNLTDPSTEQLPSGFSQRIKREWRFTEGGEVGLVDIDIDLVGIADWPVGDFALLIDDDKNFANATVYPLTKEGALSNFKAAAVNINDGQYLTVAFQTTFQIEYPLTSLDNFTLRRGIPDHYNTFPARSDVQEWVYWSRKGPNTWDVTEKMNFRLKFPPNYDPNRVEPYPMVIFFTGCGAMGRFICSYGILPSDDRYDNNNHWVSLHDEAMNRNPLDTTSFDGIVLIPQGDYEGWEGGLTATNASATMTAMFNTVEASVDRWNIDQNRIYIHGLSNGGKAVWDFANRRPDLIAAILPMSAVGNNAFVETIGHMPIWQFQGENDSNPPATASRNLYDYFQSQGGDYRYLEYPDTGHNTWTPALAEPDFYSWLKDKDQRNVHAFFNHSDIEEAGGSITLGVAPGHLSYEWYRNGELLGNETANRLETAFGGTYKVRWQRYNEEWETSFDIILTGPDPAPNAAPIVDAGSDAQIALPTETFNLVGTATDSNGTIASHQWSQVSGPSSGVFENSDLLMTEVSGLVEGTYVFRLTAIDNEGLGQSDDVQIEVLPLANQAPIVEAGIDMVRSLPIESLEVVGTAIDNDGQIVAEAWTQVSGPGVTMNSDGASLTLSDLVVGIYTFSFSATDDDNETSSDQIVINVLAEDQGDVGEVIFRINAGGKQIDDTPLDWAIDTKNDKSSYLGENSANAITGWAYDHPSNATSAPNVLFGTQRYLPSWGSNLEYKFPVDNGTYTIRLFFAEKNGSAIVAGERKFDVNFEGQTVFADLDVVQEAGNATLQKTITGQVTDGFINLAFIKGVGTPMISGIEILSGSVGNEIVNQAPSVNAGSDKILYLPENTITINAAGIDNDGVITDYTWSKIEGPDATIDGSGTPNLELSDLVEGTYLFSVQVQDDKGAIASDEVSVNVFPEIPVGGGGSVLYRINAGGTTVADAPLDWMSDTQNSKSPYLNNQSVNATTGWNYNHPNNFTSAPNAVFGTNRYGATWGDDIQYNFPVENSTYQVRLFFAEKPFASTAAGARKFGVMIEQIQVLDNFDIVEEVSVNGTSQKDLQVIVADGSLDISLIRQVGLPIISAIEIASLTAVAPVPEIDLDLIAIQDGKSNGLSVFPNPFTGSLQMSFLTGEDDESASLLIRDAQGKLIGTYEKTLLPGEYNWELTGSDLQSLNPGMYFIWLSTDTYPNQFAKIVREN